ncbi:MAG: CDP-alcohol phosphatidyltransferase family protein [Promethearchaeota archaeon]
MVSNKLRYISDAIIKPIAKGVGNSKLTPNMITILGFIVMAIAGIFTAWVGITNMQDYWLFVSLILLGISGFLDMLDGAVAKFTGQKTKFGGVLDSTLDRYSDAVFILCLIIGNYLNPPSYLVSPFITTNTKLWGILLGFLALTGAYLTSYVRSRAEIEGVKMAGVGLMERAERIAAISIGLILEITLYLGGIIDSGALFWVFIIITPLMHFTAIQRLVYSYNHLGKTNTK